MRPAPIANKHEIIAMRIAIIGCGFVADMYMKTLALHPDLELSGVYDRDMARLKQYCDYYNVRAYDNIDELLGDNALLVLNLTNPDEHYGISKRCLEAGKHVYSEKPLAMQYQQALELVELAESRGLHISSAPCSLLSETAQTMWKALSEGRIGQPYLVYAEMDDGLLHRMPYRKWISESGAPWPWKDEFEVGCTLEHAGYVLSWLPAFFGPAKRVTAMASTLIHDKQTKKPLDRQSPDLSIACITFESGVVARLSCSIIAPHDHKLMIVGEEGVMEAPDTWKYRSPVTIRRYKIIRRRMILWPFNKKIQLLGKDNPMVSYRGSSHMDFCRGAADMARAIEVGASPRLSARFSLHVNELALAIHYASAEGCCYEVKSTFDPIEPMDWAR